MWDLLLFPRPTLGEIPGSVCTKYASQSVTVITVLLLSPTWAPQGGCAGRQQNPQLVRQHCSIPLGISRYWAGFALATTGITEETELDECAVTARILEWERSHCVLSASMSQGHFCLPNKWTGFVVQMWCMQHKGFCRAPADDSIAFDSNTSFR